MQNNSVSDLARALNDLAPTVVPRLLPGGTRSGSYWHAGDVDGGKGKSLYVHLAGQHIGRWKDASTGEGGDLLDLLRIQHGGDFGKAARAARELLGGGDVMPRRQAPAAPRNQQRDGREMARKLWGLGRPITGTVAQGYLLARGIDAKALASCADMRFIPDARTREGGKTFILPALVTAVRDVAGEVTGVHRTFLSAEAPAKANIRDPKKALGHLHGGGALLAPTGKCLVIAEGIETALSVKTAFPGVAVIAALTAPHMEVLKVPDRYRRIMIAADLDVAGLRAAAALANRLMAEDRPARIVMPGADDGDFNDLLQAGGVVAVRERIRAQMKSS